MVCGGSGGVSVSSGVGHDFSGGPEAMVEGSRGGDIKDARAVVVQQVSGSFIDPEMLPDECEIVAIAVAARNDKRN